MSIRKALIKFVAETVVGNALSQIGDHVGDALGTVLGRKIDPTHAMPPKDDEPEDSTPSKRKPRKRA